MANLKEHMAHWKVSPRKWDLTYVLSRLQTLSSSSYRRNRKAQDFDKLLIPPIDVEYVKIVFDREFRSLVTQVKDHTCLDFARLANIWNLARLVGPGTFLEVGSYKGGTASTFAMP